MTSCYQKQINHHNSYIMNLRDTAKARRNTMQIYASPERYDIFKRAQAATANMYQQDLSIYNDSVQERHQRNKKQIKKLIEALNNKKITPHMLEYNTSNTFYPSYVLYHHYAQFTRLTEGLAENYPPFKHFVQKLQNFKLLGAIFEKTINVQFKKQTEVKLQNGLIKMSSDSYFYTFKTSPYIHVCCFEIKHGNKNAYVYVQLRGQNGQLCQGIQVRDLGATISPDYLNIAYRFDNVKPIHVIETQSGRLFRNALSDDSVSQLGYSLQDLAQSLYVTVKYTSMRRQFATFQKSKDERPIGEYQAVTSRIADGFATLYGLSFLRQRLINMPQVSTYMRYYLPFMHQVILERLIDLRECCGGYGYLQMSGHPGFLQRVSLRAAQPALTVVPDNKQLMKRIHYYSSDDTREGAYLKQITAKGDGNEDIFYYFVIICMRMRQNSNKLSPREYMKEFLRQSCIQMYYSNTYFDPVDPSNPTESLLPYIISKYVIQHCKFLNWDFLKVQPEQFHQILQAKKKSLLQKVSQDIPKLLETLQIQNLRNVIVGESDANAFYEKVMQASEKNKRNSEEYRQAILGKLITVIKEQRAKL